MRRHTRYLALGLVLVAGVAATWLWGSGGPGREPATPPANETAMYLHHVDVGGWYRASREETVVRAHYDLRADRLADTLPLALGTWQGEELGPSADIALWYDQPELQLRRLYRTQSGGSVWLTAIGSRGAKSFRMFEHTPPICYTASGWRTLSDDVHHVPLASGKLPVQAALFEREGVTTLVYYWYQWDSPSRDSADGIVSWRLITPVEGSLDEAHAGLQVLTNQLYIETLSWRRF